MSTSTLGGFESAERKQLFDEYLFQRRVLFGLSLSIVFMVFIWTVAICSDHWIIVASDDGEYLRNTSVLIISLCLAATLGTVQAIIAAVYFYKYLFFHAKSKVCAHYKRGLHAVTVRNSLLCVHFSDEVTNDANWHKFHPTRERKINRKNERNVQSGTKYWTTRIKLKWSVSRLSNGKCHISYVASHR